MPSFQLSVALWIIRAYPCMGHACQPNERFKILGYKLRAIVADDFGPCAGMLLQRSLKDHFDIRFLHLFAQLVMHDRSAESIEYATKVIKGSSAINILNVDMPVIMCFKRLNKARPFF